MASTRKVPDTGSRLGFALLAYMLVVTCMVTLLPLRFAWPVEWRLLLGGTPIDTLANVLLFVPLGFLFRLARSDAQRMPLLAAVAAGALLSAAIETVQFFEVARTSSLVDVGANAFGAGLGAFALGRIAHMRRAGGRIIGRLALELPLMGLIYLMVPLLWIASLASHGQHARILTTFVLGAFGAILLGGMQRAYFGPVRGARARDTAGFAGLWFAAGAFPVLVWRPLELACAAAAVALLGWILGARRMKDGASNRRFEVPLLKVAAPVYAIYLTLITLLPLAGRMGAWHISFGFPQATSHQVEILRVLEIAAAFTLVGYMVAEFRGRTVERYRHALPRLVLWSVSLVIVVETVRGYDAVQGASVARGVLTVAAALYGGWLYYLQRAHVVRLLSRGSAARSAEGGSGVSGPPAVVRQG
jgi:VanZ family protein